MILNQLLRPEIQQLIEEGKWSALRQFVSDWPAADVAELIEELPKEQRVFLFRILPRGLANDVFSMLDSSSQNQLLENMADGEARAILAGMTPDDRTTLFEEMPSEVTRRLLEILPLETRQQTLLLLGYPEYSIGRLMTTDYVAVHPDWTVERCLEHLRRTGMDKETLSYIYIVDETGRLLDELRLRKLILAPPEKKVSELMDGKVVYLNSFEPQEEAVKTFKKYDHYAMPVVDRDGVMLGIVTMDDVLDVAEEEATEDIHKGAAISPLHFSYREMPAWLLIQRRLPWLIALVFVSLVSSGVIAAFEETLSTMITLAFFIPLLMGTGGNTGSQAATLVVRALSTDDLRLGQWFSAMRKEVLVGAVLGLTLGLASSVLGFFRGGLWVGMIVGVTMVIIVLVTNLMGFLLPFLLTRCRVDPAVASSPLITSIADSICLLIYFAVATFLLSYARGVSLG